MSVDEKKLKGAIHCLSPRSCSECGSRLACVEIMANLNKGKILRNGKWRIATKTDIKQYERIFGKEWVKRYLYCGENNASSKPQETQ
jgi:hypothetical protein